MTPGDKHHKMDMQELMALPSFRRFLWRSIQHAAILHATTNGADERNLDFFEGRRSLGFDLLRDVEQGLPASHSDGMPVITLLAVLREETQPQPPKETTNVRSENPAAGDDDPDDGARRDL